MFLRSARTWISAFGLLLALLALTACASSSSPSPSAPAGASPGAPAAAAPAATAAPAAAKKPTEVVIADTGIAADLGTMDPLYDSVIKEVNINLFDPLMKVDREFVNGKPSFKFTDKGIVTSWKMVDDTTWEMKVRKDATFHDGTQLTAKDAAFSINQILNPQFKGKMASQLVGITGAQLVNDDTFTVKTDRPIASAFYKLAKVYVVPADYYQKVGAAKFGEQPIGSGPYKFVEWKKGDHVTLEANPKYWGGAPAINRAVFRYVTEAATRVAAIKSGEAQIVNNIPPQLFKDLQNSRNVNAFVSQGMQHIAFGMDGRTAPFSDQRVRQAVNFAINRKEIIDRLFDGKFARPVTGLIAEGLPGYDPALEQVYSFDPAKAKKLLADAGYQNGFKTQILYTPGLYSQIDEIVQAMVGYLADVGITAETLSGEGGQRLQMIRDGKVPGIFSTSMLNESAEPGAILDIWIERKVGRGWYWPNVDLQAAVSEQGKILSQDDRTAALKKLNQQIAEAAPFIWMHHENTGWAAASNLAFEPSWEGYANLRKVEYK